MDRTYYLLFYRLKGESAWNMYLGRYLTTIIFKNFIEKMKEQHPTFQYVIATEVEIGI
jgi:hypothetical protein